MRAGAGILRHAAIALLMVGGVVAIAAVAQISPPARRTLWDVQGFGRAQSAELSGWSDRRLQRQSGEGDLIFATRLTSDVHRATYRCTYQETRFSVPDYITARLADPENAMRIRETGFLDPTIARCGFCHQRAFLLAQALRDGGIASADLLALNGHVVTAFSANGQYFVADPDLGIAPFAVDMTDDATRMTIVRAAYQPATNYGNIKKKVLHSYEDAADDTPYYTMQLLKEASDAQKAARERIKAKMLQIAGGVAALGAMLGLLSLALRSRVTRST